MRLIANRNHETNGKFVHQVIKTPKHQSEDLGDLSGIVFESLAYSSVICSLAAQRGDSGDLGARRGRV